MLSLTEEGVEMTSRILEVINQNNTRLMEGIDEDEIRVFASVVSKIVANHTFACERESVYPRAYGLPAMASPKASPQKAPGWSFHLS